MDHQAPALDEIYFAVLERDKPEARASYLDEICECDPEMRRRVELLLEAGSHMGSFLGEPATSGCLAHQTIEAVGSRKWRHGCPLSNTIDPNP